MSFSGDRTIDLVSESGRPERGKAWVANFDITIPSAATQISRVVCNAAAIRPSRDQRVIRVEEQEALHTLSARRRGAQRKVQTAQEEVARLRVSRSNAVGKVVAHGYAIAPIPDGPA